MAISRSDGVVTSSVPVFVIGRSPFLLVLSLHLVEQGVQALEVALPELAVALQPFGGFRERLGLEPARPSLRVAAARDQAGALQHLEVLGDRGLAHRERLGQLRHGRLTRREPGEDRPPGRIRERRERRVETIVHHPPITLRFHNYQVI